MKIAWFTPFTKSSAIGRFSRLVAEELARSHDIDIWHPQADDLHRTTVRTVAFSPNVRVDPRMLVPYDVIFYNLGDYLPFHRDVWLAAQSAPGITILHDFVMHHFFADYYLRERGSRPEYLAAMVRCYGEAGRAAAERVFSGDAPPLWDTDEVMDFPLFEEAVRRAHAVVVHSGFLQAKVEARLGSPVRRIWLPYDCPPASRVVSRKELGVPADRVLLVTVGRINPNKRVPQILEALAGSPELRSRVFYAILGGCDARHRDALNALIRQHRLEQSVRLFGHVDDDCLRSWLEHADICVNLRYPAMEGGSASLAEEMLAGKPVVVTDTGVYAEVPDDCVAKVRPAHEVEDIAAALTKLAADAGGRSAMGARARRFAEREFRPATYAAGLLEFANEVRAAKPLLSLIDRMGDRLAQMGVGPDAAIVRRVAGECYSLFCDGKKG